MQLPFTIEQFVMYFLMFIRISALLFAVPIFGSREIPNVAKIGMALCTAWIVYPTASASQHLVHTDLLIMLPAMISEVMVGLVIGFSVRLIFEGVQLGGQLVGFQMGFGIVNVMDPVTGSNFSIIAQVKNLLATLLFIATGMHRLFFQAMTVSFEKIPLLQCSVSRDLISWIADLSSNMFIIGIKVAAPIMATLLFTSLTLGILAKIVPRMHIFIIAFPLKIAVGLFAVGISIPMFSIVLQKQFSHVNEYIYTIIQLGSL